MYIAHFKIYDDYWPFGIILRNTHTKKLNSQNNAVFSQFGWWEFPEMRGKYKKASVCLLIHFYLKHHHFLPSLVLPQD